MTKESSNSPASASAPKTEAPLDAEQALFEGKVPGLIARVTTDERPLQGLAGLLDWRFQGAISSYLKAGFITGGAGECAYLPLARAGKTYHVLLVGTGTRADTPAASVQALKKNLATLKLEGLGISRADWTSTGSAPSSDEWLGKTLKGSGLCILR